jgi:hypothetical protein
MRQRVALKKNINSASMQAVMLLTFRHCIILDAESQQTNQPQHEFMASLKELLGLQPVLLLIYTHIISTLTVTAAHNIPVLSLLHPQIIFYFSSTLN